MQTVTTKLTPQLTAFIDRAVEQGWYANRSEAVRDAVRLMAQRRYHQDMERAMLDDIEWAATTDEF